jgi:next-to-BRCA1 protein 1
MLTKKNVEEDAPLRASFVADNNIPDGQIFPPGAEFVKSWRMRNDGPGSWPTETELVFVAGDKLVIDKTERFKVGSVSPGEEVDVWTGEMKAPDIPGKYISYWRLCDNKGRRFGHSIWVE